MKISQQDELKRGLKRFLLVAACILFYFFVDRFQGFAQAVKVITGIIRPFIYGAVIAYLQIPLIDWIKERLEKLLRTKQLTKEKQHRAERRITAVSMVVSMLFFLSVIVALFALIIPQVLMSVRTLIVTVPAAMSGFEDQLEAWFTSSGSESTIEEVSDQLDAVYRQVESFLTAKMNSGISSAVGSLSDRVLSGLLLFKDLLVGIVVAVYIIASRSTFRRQAKLVVLALFPYKWNRPVDEEQTADWIFREASIFNNLMNGFVKGKILDSFIIGLICLVFALLARMPYAVLISVIIGVTNVIPFFGPFIGAIPTALIILTVDPVKMLIFVIFIFILQQVDGNVIGPRILGDATNLSSFWVLFSILLFGGLLGVSGMVVGVPVFGFIYQLLREIIHKRLDRQKTQLKEYLDADDRTGGVMDDVAAAEDSGDMMPAENPGDGTSETDPAGNEE